MLITRADPPLRLTRLRGRKQLVEVRGVHLRFTEQEAAELLEHFLGAPASPAIVALLSERTEGWPVGLQLAAISLREQADQATFAAAFAGSTDVLIAEYLVHEVLYGMPAAEKEFLLSCSVLDRLCAALCAAVLTWVTPQPPAQDFLEAFWKRNLFLVALDNEGRWYRFHHLFRSLLRHQLELAATSQEIAALHERASYWHEQQGNIEQALYYSLAADDASRAAQLVEQNVHTVLNREEWRRLEHWLGVLPPGVKQRSALLVAQAWLEQFRFRFAAIPPLLALAEQNLAGETSYAATERSELIGNIHALRAIAAITFGTPQAALHESEQALTLVPQHQLYARGVAEHYYARALMQSGDLTGAVHGIQRFLAEHGTQPDAQTQRMLLALCAIYFDYGDPNALKGAATTYLRVAERTGQQLSIAWANVCLGWAHYQQNDLAGAKGYFNSVIEAHFTAHIRAVIEGYTGLALTLQAENQLEQARATADALAAWLTEHETISLLPTATALRAKLDLAAGVTPATRSIQVSEGPNLVGLELWVMPALVQVQLWLHDATAEALARAESLLAKCRALAGARNFRRRLIEIDALEALRLAAVGQQEDALTLLARSVTSAETGGALRLVVDAGPRLQPLLQELLVRNLAPVFVQQLLTTYAPAGAPVLPLLRTSLTDKAFTPVDTLLTNREMEVLLLLAERLTNKEIAHMLTLSPRTVKKHTINIYQKLQVESRRAAVSEARRIGILPMA